MASLANLVALGILSLSLRLELQARWPRSFIIYMSCGPHVCSASIFTTEPPIPSASEALFKKCFLREWDVRLRVAAALVELKMGDVEKGKKIFV